MFLDNHDVVNHSSKETILWQQHQIVDQIHDKDTIVTKIW